MRYKRIVAVQSPYAYHHYRVIFGSWLTVLKDFFSSKPFKPNKPAIPDFSPQLQSIYHEDLLSSDLS